MEGYGAFLIFFLIALVVASVMTVLNDILGAKRRDPLRWLSYSRGRWYLKR